MHGHYSNGENSTAERSSPGAMGSLMHTSASHLRFQQLPVSNDSRPSAMVHECCFKLFVPDNSGLLG